MNTIEIKTDLSGEELQVLIWELEAFCEGKRLPKPVLRQADVSGLLCPRCKSSDILEADKENDNQCKDCNFVWA